MGRKGDSSDDLGERSDVWWVSLCKAINSRERRSLERFLKALKTANAPDGGYV
jgi:hypothetical protein